MRSLSSPQHTGAKAQTSSIMINVAKAYLECIACQCVADRPTQPVIGGIKALQPCRLEGRVRHGPSEGTVAGVNDLHASQQDLSGLA